MRGAHTITTSAQRKDKGKHAKVPLLYGPPGASLEGSILTASMAEHVRLRRALGLVFTVKALEAHWPLIEGFI